MIAKIILNLGLVCVPFFWWAEYNTRDPKMALALAFALALSLICFYKGKMKPFRNIWLLIFLGYLVVGYFFSPKIIFKDLCLIPNFHVWKPYLYIAVFSMMLISVSTMKLTVPDKMFTIKVMSWVGFVMSLYVICQFFGLDQFYKEKIDNVLCITQPHLGGTLGSPTIVASFIAMLVPFAIHLKKWVFVIAMGTAVIMTKSIMSIGAMTGGILFYIFFVYKLRAAAVLLTIIVLLIGYGVKDKTKLLQTSGRITEWKYIVSEIKEDQALTGRGMGSYLYLHLMKHKCKFRQAHNDYLELAHNAGIIGLALFLTSIGYMIYLSFSVQRLNMVFVSSFVIIGLCAFGSFVFQLNPHIYYSIVIAGFLHNKQEGSWVKP